MVKLPKIVDIAWPALGAGQKGEDGSEKSRLEDGVKAYPSGNPSGNPVETAGDNVLHHAEKAAPIALKQDTPDTFVPSFESIAPLAKRRGAPVPGAGGITEGGGFPAPKRGALISFEGGEGTGKSTQLHLLAKRLAALSLDVLVTREPGGTPAAEILRHCLLAGEVRAFGGLAEALVFNAARLDHLDAVIRPALARGALVLCDRFCDSTRVYQHVIGKVSLDVLTNLEAIVLDGLMPDLTFVLDLDVRLAMERLVLRAGKSGVAMDRFESESLALHNDLRSAFLQLPQRYPARCFLMDSGAGKDATHDAIFAKVAQRFAADYPSLAAAHQSHLQQQMALLEPSVNTGS